MKVDRSARILRSIRILLVITCVSIQTVYTTTMAVVLVTYAPFGWMAGGGADHLKSNASAQMPMQALLGHAHLC